jgi:Zn-dependent protease with chaperone function
MEIYDHSEQRNSDTKSLGGRNQYDQIGTVVGRPDRFADVHRRSVRRERRVVIAFLFAVVMNFGAYWFSDKIILKMYKAQEVTEHQAPEIYAPVCHLILKAAMPMPKVYIIPEDTPNTFATGRDEKHAVVAVTEGILRILSREELEGVLAHELTHIKNKDMLIGSITATLAGATAMLANMAHIRRDKPRQRGGGRWQQHRRHDPHGDPGNELPPPLSIRKFRYPY